MAFDSTVDLHTHTTASDGTLAPAALVARAAAQGVRLLAVTDHDTVAGVDEAVAAARRHGVRLLAGVEISVTWERRTLHVLGLRIDPAHPSLERGLTAQAARRTARAEAIAARLARAGVADALAGARRWAGDGLIARPHFARYLVESGHAGDVADAFRRFLRHGRPGHVVDEWATLETAIGWIADAGGVAALAHPLRYGFTNAWRRRATAAFQQAGGGALEVVTGGAGHGDVESAAALARRFGLAASVGSDFHEPGHPWRELGRLRPLPGDMTPVWRCWEGDKKSGTGHLKVVK